MASAIATNTVDTVMNILWLKWGKELLLRDDSGMNPGDSSEILLS